MSDETLFQCECGSLHCHDRMISLETENARLRGVLEKISKVNQNRPELGQFIGSEHYRAAWLDCVVMAGIALSASEEGE